MNRTRVGVLTISDRCAKGEAVDESGSTLIGLIEAGTIRGGVLVKADLVPDSKRDIEEVLKRWCDDDNIHVILTTGGTGLSERDVTPEATAAVLEKTVPGICNLLFKHSSAVTPLAALSRAVAGVRGKSLIINFPGSKKACKECLEAVAGVIPHAVDLINDRKKEVEEIHRNFDRRKSSVRRGDEDSLCRTESPYPCISVEEAQEVILSRIHLIRKERTVGYEEAFDHVLAQDIIAQSNHPPFDCSLMDGYAVVSTDRELVKTLIGVCKMGECPSDRKVVCGSCMRVSTGGCIPPGADAVVKVESTEVEPPNDNSPSLRIKLKAFPNENENIRKMGSDFKVGEWLLHTGDHLDSAGVGLLGTLGKTSVRVFSKPVVAVLSTGNELCHPDEDLQPGKVRDSNRITLLSLLKEANLKTVDLGISPDEPDSILESLEEGFRKADVVVTTGSMSMGERDFMKEVIVSDFGGEIYFGRVLMKPGKPTAFGIVTFEGKPKAWFGLPGNPASAFVTAHLFLLPGLRAISRRKDIYPREVAVEIEGLMPPLENRPHYVRTRLSEKNGKLVAAVEANQRSSWIGNCVSTNCLVLHPPKKKGMYTGLLIGKPHFTP